MSNERSQTTADEILAKLRARGWSVAVHNDYKAAGHSCTFWLLTHPSGRWVKGEADTDVAALQSCHREIERNGLEGPPYPFATRMKENDGGNGWLELGFSTYAQAEQFWRWAERLQNVR